MKLFGVIAIAFAMAGCSATLDSTIEQTALPLSGPSLPEPSSGTAKARAYSAIVVDTKSGKILHEDRATELRYPASLTKMMTLYLVFEQIKAKRITLNTPLRVSRNAAAQPPSKIGVKAGSTIKVSDAIRALAVKSGNDVAVVIAENLGGSEANFANRMTLTARSLGMTQTRFVNASGLPDTRQVTSARDMAILSRAIKLRHPIYARYFSQREFRYAGRTFRATNRLLGTVKGVDGIKTGYIRLSGYNLAASARRGRKSIIVVVIGGRTGTERNKRVTALVERYM